MKRVETKKRVIDDEIERRKMKRRYDVDEFKVVEGVIDPPTLKVLYKLLNKGTLRAVHGVISTGKEANVYRGENLDREAVAVKIYRMSTAETDFMREYIVGDPRFKRVGKKNRVLIPQWAMKEYRNLKRYFESEVKVPEPIDIERNVVVMEFIGDLESNQPAPLLKNVVLEDPVDVFDEIIHMIDLSYNEAGLVHADLSEFNILWNGGPVFIDVSQSVLTIHENAKRYLYRDIQNIVSYFTKLGVEKVDPLEIAKHIISKSEE